MGWLDAPSEEQCYGLLRRLRWPNGITCPWCKHRRVTTHSKCAHTPRRRYLCLGCRRTFTDLTGTPFTRTNLPLGSWFLYLQLSEEGRSTSELAKGLRVKWDTIAYMRRRLSASMAGPALSKQLHDMIEQAEQGG